MRRRDLLAAGLVASVFCLALVPPVAARVFRLRPLRRQAVYSTPAQQTPAGTPPTVYTQPNVQQVPSYGDRWSNYNFGRQDFDVYPNRD